MGYLACLRNSSACFIVFWTKRQRLRFQPTEGIRPLGQPDVQQAGLWQPFHELESSDPWQVKLFLQST